jgi:glutathione synthase/RimK-type ligase-like ATP-grasp enzyme
MTMRALGVYRETEFSPGKVEHDAAILDAVLAELKRQDVEVSATSAARFVEEPPGAVDLVLAMCQGERALGRLVALEQRGAIAINSALAIRNCYRDLLCAGLVHAGVPVPTGALVRTDARPPDLTPLGVLDLDAPMFVKRGDLHALAPDDVQRVQSRGALRAALAGMAQRGVTIAYVQQAVEGRVIKFYGVSGGEYFAALVEEGSISERVQLELAKSAAAAAATLGLEAWGGDAIIDGEQFMMIDFNDWPSFSRVREAAARAIARRCLMLVRRPRQGV